MAKAPAAPTHLRTGYLTDPLGIDAERPDLSWRPAAGRQRAYRIQVASTPRRLAGGEPDLWDSGRVAGERGVAVPYAGHPLGSGRRACWRVRVWDEDGTASAWSRTAGWETGLLEPADWGGARWVTAPEWAPPATEEHDPDRAMPLLARDFHLDAPLRRARLYATALGVYVPTVNGRRIAAAELEPGYTAYDKRLLYATYDVTGALRAGANTVGFRLAGGIAHVPDVPGRYQKLHVSYGLPRLLAVLRMEAEDGSVTTLVTDESWRTAPGPVTLSDWFGGEEYDARRERPGWDAPGAAARAGWRPAVAVPAPDVALTARAHPPVEVVAELTAVSVDEPQPGVHVVDFGVNIAGRPELRVAGPAGTTVTLRPAELLNDDGTVNQRFTGRPCYDAYTLRGDATGTEEVWHPVTVYHGFRYVQVEGLPGHASTATVRAQVLRAANPPAGGFDCSDELITGIHRLVDRAVQSNMYSVLTDCPHREKLGWLEETHLVFPAVADNYDVAAYYRKLVRDMADAQTASGLVPGIAPEYTVFADKFRDDPNWGGAIVLAPWLLYRRYGDTPTLRAHYPHMERYLDHLASRADGDLLSHGLGDWMSFDNSTPKAVTATYAYHRLATAMGRIAAVLGRENDARDYAALADRVGRAFHLAFFDAGRHTYATGSQAADALALELGVVPPAERDAVLAHLVAAIRAEGDHVTVGEIALPSLLRVLSAHGRDDVVHDLVTRTDSPSYGYQIAHGATALTERWDGPTRGSSQNHFMLGAIQEWLTASLAGIRQADDSVAFDRIVIRPAPVGDLTHVDAWYDTPRGRVRSSWRRPPGGGFLLDVTVPPGAPARVEVPLPGGAAPAPAPPGARALGAEGDRAVYEAGPGNVRFSAGA
ncbi:alpha-L-rhamnosidase [Streptomyces sp. MP131-18]|uniref:alpha-L-rhamnosidase n=1 Tax=Streptomyces sp. MP131-18 TaxID=1857892 RepID=UPI00097C679C|nr:alpha-L-rhamnosidase [Streptomyces sp. MP131-18]ONK09638.1 Bacterial alpha-L-rhamnosidase [Streptomyces sp. MP131-18]